jgi:hypothetical protein
MSNSDRNDHGWVLLLYALPRGRNSLRVNLWRKLKKTGAVSLNTSASLLPDTPANFEQFQWFAKQLVDGGGAGTLIRTKEIEGMPSRQVVALFNDARAEDYNALAKEITSLLRAKRKRAEGNLTADLQRLHGRFAELQAIDFFECPRGHDTLMLLKKAAGLSGNERSMPPLKRGDYQGRIWLTRPNPKIDRVGSAWLIQTFIDPGAKFAFGCKPEEYPNAVPYDMADAELTHQGDDCTFETLLKRFALRDRALEQIAHMVHDADLHDEKYHAPGADGIDRVLDGLGRLGWSDERILQHGMTCFEALYAQVRSS